MKPRTSTKYGLIGVTMLVEASAMRYMACVVSGLTPRIINIGTNIGAMSVHWAEPLVMSRFSDVDSRTNPMNSTDVGTLSDSSHSAPRMDRTSAIPVHEK